MLARKGLIVGFFVCFFIFFINGSQGHSELDCTNADFANAWYDPFSSQHKDKSSTYFFFPGVYIVYTVPYITLKSFPKLYTNPGHKKFTIFPLTGSGISTNNEVLNINQIGLYP